MEKSRILLGLLFIVLVSAFVKCQETTSYISEDGELITDPPSLPQPDVSGMMTSDGTCLKVGTIIYYENYFRDGWVGQGNDPIARVESIMDSLEIKVQMNYGFEVNFDIEAIEHYDAVHTASDFPRSAIIAADGRSPDAWIFLAYENDTTGHVGSAGGDICGGFSVVYEAYDYSGGNSDTSLVNGLAGAGGIGSRLETYVEQNRTCLDDCANCEDNWTMKKCNKKCNAKKCLKSKSCKKNCRNTCDLCGIEEPCEDQKSSKFCKKQLKKGKCSQSSVWKKCKKTCDAC